MSAFHPPQDIRNFFKPTAKKDDGGQGAQRPGYEEGITHVCQNASTRTVLIMHICMSRAGDAIIAAHLGPSWYAGDKGEAKPVKKEEDEVVLP